MKKLLTPQEAAKKLKVAHGTLAVWRCLGRGPKFIKLGLRSVRYTNEELDNFINEKNKK